ncbi:MAG: tetratricopeptide repeat protein [Eubacteriales bacterium]
MKENNGAKQNVVPFKQSPQYFIKKASQAEKSDRLLDALVYYRKARDMEPGNISVLTAMADIYTELEYFEESNALIYEAMRKDPASHEDLIFLMGCNYMGMSYLSNADTCFKQYQKEHPNGEYKDEINDFFDIIGNMPLDTMENAMTEEALNTYSKIYTARRLIIEKQEAKSIEIYQGILKDEPKNITVLNDLALAYYAMGDMKKAIDCNKKVLDIEPENVAAISNLIVFYKSEGNEFSAKKYTVLLSDLNISTPDDLHKAAFILSWAKEYQKAYRCVMELLDYNLHDANALHMAAISAFNIGEYDEAMDYWEAVQKLLPDNVTAQYYINKAKACKQTGCEDKLEYLFEIPMEEAEAQVEGLQEALIQSADDIKTRWEQDFAFRSLLIWALSNFEGDLYSKLVDLLLTINDDRALFELYRQLLNPKIEREDKKYIVSGLIDIDETPPFFVDIDGKVEQISQIEELSK